MDLYWLPVAAGKLSPARKWSLWVWEALDAAAHRRPRKKLYHSALKLADDAGRVHTVELMPDFAAEAYPPAVTGPVGFRGADRWRWFRYRLSCRPAECLPDEDWTVAVVRVGDGAAAARVIESAPSVPRHVWGRRAAGTNEMWTSDSAISWLLLKAGVPLDGTAPPPEGRAPGWFAGIEAFVAEHGAPG